MIQAQLWQRAVQLDKTESKFHNTTNWCGGKGREGGVLRERERERERERQRETQRERQRERERIDEEREVIIVG